MNYFIPNGISTQPAVHISVSLIAKRGRIKWHFLPEFIFGFPRLENYN